MHKNSVRGFDSPVCHQLWSGWEPNSIYTRTKPCDKQI